MDQEQQPVGKKRPVDEPIDGDEQPQAAPQKQQVGKKRPAPVDEDERDEDVPRPKRGAPAPSATMLRSADVAAAAASAQDEEMPSITEQRDPYMFYPENYGQFDTERLMLDGEPQKSKLGGGMMMFLKYMWKDGVQKNLCVQAPKMFLPGGINEFREEGKSKVNTSCLASFGKEWENNPQMVAFKALCAQIVRACARIIMNKQLHLPYCPTLEDVLRSFTPICEKTEKESKDDPSKMITYEPSIKLVVNTSPTNRSMFVTQVMSPEGPIYVRVPHDKVEKGGTIIPMVNFQWFYRKKFNNPAKWSFSMHASIYQAVVGGASSVGSGMSSRLVVMT